MRDELAIDLGGVVDADLNTFRGVLQADPGHARALAESGLTLMNSPGWCAGVVGRNANSAMNTLLGRASPTCRGPVRNTSGRRTHRRHAFDRRND